MVAAFIRLWSFSLVNFAIRTKTPPLRKPVAFSDIMLQRPLLGFINMSKSAEGRPLAYPPLFLRHRRTRATQSHPVRRLPPFHIRRRPRAVTMVVPGMQTLAASNPLRPMTCAHMMPRANALCQRSQPLDGPGSEIVRTRNMARRLLLHQIHGNVLRSWPQRLRRLRDHPWPQRLSRLRDHGDLM